MKRFFKIEGDRTIWLLMFLLSGISILLVYSSTGSLAYRANKSNSYFLFKQAAILITGVLIVYGIHLTDHRKIRRAAVVCYWVSLPLLVYILFFGGLQSDSSMGICLRLGNINLQPYDFARLSLWLFLARVLSVKSTYGSEGEIRPAPVLIPICITCALIAPANLFTAVVTGVTAMAILFMAGVRLKYVFLFLLISFIGVFVAFTISKLSGYGRGKVWEQRVTEFIPERRSHSKDLYQVEQAKIAIARGGILGLGPGHSSQKIFLPHSYSDGIFSITIEEYGLAGACFIMALYVILLGRCMLVFKNCPDLFGSILAMALSISFIFQAMFHMAMNAHLIPVGAVTLPFIGMVGISSIWFNCVAIGIVLSISRHQGDDRDENMDINALALFSGALSASKSYLKRMIFRK